MTDSEKIEVLRKALADLVDAEMEYGEPDNVPVNEALLAARAALDATKE